MGDKTMMREELEFAVDKGDLPLQDEGSCGNWADGFEPIADEQEKLRNTALDEARRSRALRPDLDRLKALEEHARAKIRSHHAELYDPKSNQDDKAREERFERLKDVELLQDEALQHAEARLRQLRAELAEVLPGTEPVLGPILWMVIAVATLAIAATLIPTIVDALS